MWREQSKIQLLWGCLYHPFDYHTDVSLRYWPDGRSGGSIVMMKKDSAMKLEKGRKIVIIDCDGVVNRYGTPPPVMFYITYLIERLDHLRDKEHRIKQNLVGMESSDDPNPFARNLEYDFVKAGLTKRLHDDACAHAAESFQLVPGYEIAMNNVVNRMAYRPFMLSASPEDLIGEASRKLRICDGDFRGTRFNFKEGLFTGMDLNLGQRRSSMRDEIMQNSVSTRYGFEIMFDDNWVTGRRMMKVGSDKINIWAGKSEPVSSNVSISKQEMRYHFGHLESSLERIERGQGTILLMDESEWLDAVESSKEFVAVGRRALEETGPEFYRDMYRALRCLMSHLDGMRGIFPSSSTKISEMVASVRSGSSERESKAGLSRLIDVFYGASLEAKMDLASFK